MSRVRADKLVNRNATGAPSLTYGAEVPVGYGITGAGGINVSGMVTASGGFGGNATGLTGTPDITVNNITGVGATLTATTESSSTTSGALIISGGVGIAKSLNVGGNVTVGGTLTYEDVTNVDVLGIATYRQSLYVGSTEGSGAGAGVSMHSNGNAIFAGITTVTNFDATGTLVEAFSSTTTAYSSAGDLNISNGNVQFSSANLAGTNNTLNIISTTGINTDLAEGQTLTVTAISAVNASTAYVNRINVDGVATGITTHWVGGEIPSEGGGSGVDLYTFNLLKTGSSTYIIVANHSKTSSQGDVIDV